ncbi:MAG: rubrerythrin [Candidatus Coatesbacteria bacterium]|nr:rubrerythrin [Candidatus Coatesbacteria bacterium]
MSLKSFSADEVFEMAERIERNGARFYRRAAENFLEEDLKRLLLDLAVMEDEHEATFKELRGNLTGGDAAPTVFDPDNQAVLYLQALADGYVFDTAEDPAESLTGQESAEAVLRTALGLERDSIAFYVGIQQAMPPKWGRDKIDWIISEEFGHVSLLSDRLRRVLEAK